jgi:hypothetical protein
VHGGPPEPALEDDVEPEVALLPDGDPPPADDPPAPCV